MKDSIAAKFLAFLLTACVLVTVLACAVFAGVLAGYDLYNVSPEEKQEQWYHHAGYPMAWQTAQQYAALMLGECPEALVQQLYGFSSSQILEHYYISVRQGDKVVYTALNPIEGGVTCEYTITPEYPKVVSIINPAATNPTQEEGSDPTGISLPQLDDFLFGTEPVRVDKVDILEDGQNLVYELYYYNGPTYTVSVTMTPEALKDTFHSNLVNLYPYRYMLIWVAALGLICLAALLVWLICTAGKTHDGRICPAGLNRLPLDIYLMIAVLVSWPMVALIIHIIGESNSLSFLTVTIMLLCATGIALLLLALIYALAAQIKVGGGFWWRHSVIGVVLQKLWKLLRFTGRAIRSVFRLIPVMWQWLLTAFVMAASLGISILIAYNDQAGLVLLQVCCVICICIVCYGGYCYGTILVGARKMSKGQLEYKIPTKYLCASFRDCAEQLNALSGAAMEAVQKQVRAEHMKTELITNVSHDIKTPLTSIINFVDLLQKPHTQLQQEQYLEVLSRQSQRLKKLIEDLMDLSKASTGNIIVHITQFDAVESVNQALGEFTDKLEAAHLTPVFHAPEQSMMISADGRLVWRVLSNLLSNAVKYATPGTRLYVELTQVEDRVLLSMKNVSREELRYSAEELMERFVQGDASRNMEGSGLGLNIAKSLMEVQHGKLSLLLDGDLFKVTLEFPAA